MGILTVTVVIQTTMKIQTSESIVSAQAWNLHMKADLTRAFRTPYSKIDLRRNLPQTSPNVQQSY